MSNFKFLEHTADIKFQAYGKDIEEAFENSALAMFNSMYNSKIKDKEKFKIIVQGKDFESLLYNFLEELLFLLDSKNFFLSKIKNIKINKRRLKLEAEILGDDAKNYPISLNVKAITYNQMFVKKQENKWITQIVLDV
jgi:SHS2 domain-containing protein